MDNKSILTGIIIGLLVGAGLGYVFGSMPIQGLQSEINTLSTQKNSLQTQINSLNSQVENLNKIVNLQMSTVLDKDKTVNMIANTHTILSYPTQYSGYLQVSFTSTIGIHFVFGNSQLPNTWYARYPISGTQSTGTFKIPVTASQTQLDIANSALFQGATVTLTVTYFY